MVRPTVWPNHYAGPIYKLHFYTFTLVKALFATHKYGAKNYEESNIAHFNLGLNNNINIASHKHRIKESRYLKKKLNHIRPALTEPPNIDRQI